MNRRRRRRVIIIIIMIVMIAAAVCVILVVLVVALTGFTAVSSLHGDPAAFDVGTAHRVGQDGQRRRQIRVRG